ncbi:CUE domain-containing protein 1 [Lutzomyia longipalpis]|uniref:CUE domain-containing protein 1 n=1 Tax=Lutzomyia longipalpis TaxID=7200 RepID=UPI0024840425|nr:CUE domain-containing protein 1 [Lutzomyia longipalpis]XP_055685944.1 CUE domain-containing protein 1 [Lutzomyia longipalpis]
MASTMQLEFSQAMSDFKTMFPEMDRDVIEAVLRVNKGAVDATIDQLLAMSTDNQNEKLRNELEKSGSDEQRISRETSPIPPSTTPEKQTILLSTSPANLTSTGASPKVKKASTSPEGAAGMRKRWDPPILSPLPPTFLRIANINEKGETDFPDEQFALMLQNEEFMNELRWNQEFMMALEKEQQGKARTEDDAVFKERLKHMGKKSRKKFLQLARVFTWQKNKKPGAVRHPDSLLLQEEHSDDDEPRRTKK